MSDDFGNYSVVAAPTPSRVVAPPAPVNGTAAESPSWIISRTHRPEIRGRYDSAQTTDENVRQWQWADALSAKSANSRQVRTILRNRSRYEAANNCYASGIAETLADDLIGYGPRLQVQTDDDALNALIEKEFADWSLAVGLADKLHTMREARAVDGEAFMFLETDPNLDPIQLDLCLYEAEQVSTPYPYPLSPYQVDGITLNRNYKPLSYDLLKEHPGDDLRFLYGFEFDTIPAKYVIHWFLRRRAHQFRGIPEFAPALPLFSQLRRFTLAALSAAELAADFAAVIHSDLPPNATFQDGKAFEAIDIEHRMMMTLPAGWKMSQFIPQQPSATYDMFKHEILNEIARTLKVPFSIAAGNSSKYNYASGRLDHQTYYRALDVDRKRLEYEVLDRVFKAWLAEASLVTDWVKGGVDRPDGWPRRWLWQGFEHIDPLKEAKAQQVRMQALTTTFSDECLKDGVDPISRIKTIAKDVGWFEEYGLPNPYISTLPTQGATDEPAPSGGGKGNAGSDAQGGGHNGHSRESLVPRNGRHRP